MKRRKRKTSITITKEGRKFRKRNLSRQNLCSFMTSMSTKKLSKRLKSTIKRSSMLSESKKEKRA
jgi:hypothetical protein